MKHTHVHTLRNTPPFSQYADTKGMTNTNAQQTQNCILLQTKTKTQIIIRYTPPPPPPPCLGKLSSADIMMHAHTELMTGIIVIKN